MRKLAWDTSFERAYRKWVRKNPGVREHIFEVLDLLAADTFAPAIENT